MYLGLSLGDFVKNPQGDLFRFRRDLGAAIDHLGDLMQVSMGVFGRVLDRHRNRAKTAFLDGLGSDRNLPQAHRADGRFDLADVQLARFSTQVNERPQGHVAADSAQTVKIGDSSHEKSNVTVVGSQVYR